MRSICTLGLLAAALIPVAAQAEDAPKGFYGSLTIGGASVSDVNSTVYAPSGDIFDLDEGSFVEEASVQSQSIPAGSDTVTGKFDVKTAVIFGGSLGYDFGMVRTDLEVSYSRGTLRRFNVTGGTTGGTAVDLADAVDGYCFYTEFTCPTSGASVSMGSSKLRQLNAMGNVWVDVPVGSSLGLEPYVGGGVGVAGFEVEGEGKARFAWQIGGGVAYRITKGLAVTADVRYRQANGATLDDDGYGVDIDKIKTVSYGLGLRYNF